jgi:hypothetical protein
LPKLSEFNSPPDESAVADDSTNRGAKAIPDWIDRRPEGRKILADFN